MIRVFFFVFIVDENIIQVSNDKVIQVFSQDIVDEGLVYS
jgi:hypothetical protein